MFQGAFSYDKKGPYYVWEAETSHKKKARKKDLEACNALRELIDRKKQEKERAQKLADYITKYRRKPRGKRAVWKYCDKTGAYKDKKGQGGINWYKY